MFRLVMVSGSLMALWNLLLFNLIQDSHSSSRSVHDPTALYAAFAGSCQSLRTLEDIRQCYPSQPFRNLPANCQTITSWNDLQRCLTGRFVPVLDLNSTQYTVHIIGERNSGTKWLQEELQQCFPRNVFHFKAHRDFIRSKHFFQPIRGGDYTKSMVVSIFRHPVDWVAAMREYPYHSPRHLHGFDNSTGRVIPLPWRDFVSTVWATKRTEFDLQLIRQDRVEETLNGVECAQGFALDEVVPCRYNVTTKDNEMHRIPIQMFRGYEPIYELRRDHSGRPFPSILDLRREKIINFALELPLLMRIGGYAAVRYEDLLLNGTRYLLMQVADMLGLGELPAHCRPSGPQPDRIGRRFIDPEFRQYVEQHMDVTTERLLGYA